MCSLGLVAGGVILTEMFGVRSCYLCNLQRLIYLIVAFFAFVGVVFKKKICAVLTAITASGGVITAIYQSFIEITDQEGIGCGIGESTAIEQLVDSLGRLWPTMFMVTGGCDDRAWTFLALSLANWSALFFLSFFAITLWLFFRHN